MSSYDGFAAEGGIVAIEDGLPDQPVYGFDLSYGCVFADVGPATMWMALTAEPLYLVAVTDYDRWCMEGEDAEPFHPSSYRD